MLTAVVALKSKLLETRTFKEMESRPACTESAASDATLALPAGSMLVCMFTGLAGSGLVGRVVPAHVPGGHGRFRLGQRNSEHDNLNNGHTDNHSNDAADHGHVEQRNNEHDNADQGNNEDVSEGNGEGGIHTTNGEQGGEEHGNGLGSASGPRKMLLHRPRGGGCSRCMMLSSHEGCQYRKEDGQWASELGFRADQLLQRRPELCS